jgi:hypothetical protein
MAWKTHIHSSRGNRGSYGELPGSTLSLADSGWDTATMVIATRLDPSSLFSKGTPHPDYAGMYAVSVEKGDVWRGDINRAQVRFAGLVGGANGMVTRSEIEGANRIERTVTASDFYGGGSGYGSEDRPLFSLPGGLADAIRFIALQPFSEKQFITSIAPPTTYSLEALKIGAKTLRLAPPQQINGIAGVELIANYPNGMLAGSVRYAKHPAGNVSMWLLDIRWECVPEKEVA